MRRREHGGKREEKFGEASTIGSKSEGNRCDIRAGGWDR
jgi:hypothetical protein